MQLRIKVKPNSKKDEILREADGTLIIKISAQPVEGKANKYLIEYLSKALGIPKSKIVVVKGEGSPFKTLDIEGDESIILNKLRGAERLG